MDFQIEFERQVQNLVEKNYPELCGMDINSFTSLFTKLKESLPTLQDTVDIQHGHLPFVIVIKSTLHPSESAMNAVVKDGKVGVTKLIPHTSSDFQTIESVELPSENVYLLIDIDRGKDTLNVRPEDAMITIVGKDRSPLTIDEGVAIVTQYPEFLMKNNCFSLLASRHLGDQRVPAIWINGNKQPNLGWCWDRNPHTWLGSASCKMRLG